MSIINTTNHPIKNLQNTVLYCESLIITNLDYKHIMKNGFEIKINPNYFTLDNDITFDFTDSYFIDFNQVTSVNDLNIQKFYDEGNVPYYRYLDTDSKSVLIELQLLYRWGNVVNIAPRYYVECLVNGVRKNKIQSGIFDNKINDNIFSNRYIFTVNYNDRISFHITKIDDPDNDTYTLLSSSFLCFKSL